MLEIYSEQVRDLLNPKTMNLKGGLKVRQDPKGGFYGMTSFTDFEVPLCKVFFTDLINLFLVEGMKSVGVNNYNEISQKID